VTTRDAEWDDSNRSEVLALLDFEEKSCSHCGGWLPDTTDPKNEGKYQALDPIRCHRCTALHSKRADYNEPHHQALVLWPTDLR